MSQPKLPDIDALLHIPQLAVQNANAISGPHSWGHPGPTHFTGQMTALERKLGADFGLHFVAVGIISHGYQTQTNGDYVQRFNLSRNPVGKDGSTCAIVEEGRIHLQLSLVYGLQLDTARKAASDETLDALAQQVGHTLATLRIAGGSILPGRSALKPRLIRLADGQDDRATQFRHLRRYLMPGYALVARDDLLHSHLATLQQDTPDASLLDAWLDQSRLNHIPTHDDGNTVWQQQRGSGTGWIVPLPVGYGAISPLYEAGTVAGTRDDCTPVRFVESLYSLGQWLSPHRLHDYRQLLWYPTHDAASGVYRCRNDYQAATQTEHDTVGVTA
ncbi:type I-F CRISPR-associated protein Csy2 [Craterilacuibacter sinensis]|uniref:Type I-F CRISPR-associated protein Csy2 n=1 Tax=Craterilacuibacter sinensis TaxID=2686017 RepID=A0A845BLM2_9NEIS|nr:type I-F CRISPR-associated protein Csy2 [Craterilacuibacter sinensis]MXR37225.1 type I-F CRISPR-associated protein Csy2 [Craterilacuibacter sinensis]